MSLDRIVNSISRPAGADLSSNLHRILFVEDDGQVNVNSSNATACLGILLNKPSAADQAARVAIVGSVVKCEAGAAVAERAAIRAVTGGRGSATVVGGDFIVGHALTTAAGSGEFFELEVNPSTFGTAD